MKKFIFISMLSLFYFSAAEAGRAPTRNMTCSANKIYAPEAALFGLDKMQPFNLVITPQGTYDDPEAQDGWVIGEINKLAIANQGNGRLISSSADNQSAALEFMIQIHPQDPRKTDLILSFNALYNKVEFYMINGSGNTSRIHVADGVCNTVHLQF